MKKIEKIFNVQTGEETIVEREETAAEKELRLEAIAKAEAALAETEARSTAKAAAQSKLAALGLTVEDLQALGL
jgi:hypothetical protein